MKVFNGALSMIDSSNVSKYLAALNSPISKSERNVKFVEYGSMTMNSLKHYTDKKYIDLILKPSDYTESSRVLESGNWRVEFSSLKDKFLNLFASESKFLVVGEDGIVRKAVEKKVVDVNGKVHKTVSCHTSKRAKPEVSSKKSK